MRRTQICVGPPRPLRGRRGAQKKMGDSCAQETPARSILRGPPSKTAAGLSALGGLRAPRNLMPAASSIQPRPKPRTGPRARRAQIDGTGPDGTPGAAHAHSLPTYARPDPACPKSHPPTSALLPRVATARSHYFPSWSGSRRRTFQPCRLMGPSQALANRQRNCPRGPVCSSGWNCAPGT